MEAAFPLRPRKAHLRAWVNTFIPRGPDEIKHQRHALYVSQKHWPMFITSDHLGFFLFFFFTRACLLDTASHSRALTHRSEVPQTADSLLAVCDLNACDCCNLPESFCTRSNHAGTFWENSLSFCLSADDQMVSQGETNASAARGNKPTASPAVSSVTDIPHWFV